MIYMRFAFIAGPALLVLYGLIRLAGQSDGDYGPGADWQLAHLAGLLGMIAFIPVVLAMARMIGNRAGRVLVGGLTLLGLAASMVQFAVDMIEAAMAAD